MVYIIIQGRRKVANIGEAPIKSVMKFPENIGGAQLLTALNIGGARAPVPPLFLRPWQGKYVLKCKLYFRR